MFRKVLVANRGEIAVRVIRACQEMGIAAAAIYSDADRDALHVRVADEAHHIGPAPAADSYLSIDRIVEAAVACGAQAVHPGYGFLAENPEFAEACLEAGLTFVGPTPEAIRRLGNKSRAKELAQSVDVPVVPGYYGSEQDDDSLVGHAHRLGMPVLVKAAAGGGGRGMRLVQRESQLRQALRASRREAAAAFGDGALLLERYIAKARHVEVQVIGDSSGDLVYMGERECSLQRRYQKVIEECPSPVVGEELRRSMGEAAVRLAAAGGYTNAGTIEFLLDEQEEFYFLEMNTRLQVEHPVTELTTAWDLVRLQLMVADSQHLPFTQQDITLKGHAIEARLYAEDPAQGYLPQTGRLLRFRPPEAPWVRNDVGVYEGGEVSEFYDPLLAKLIVYGPDRQAAVERLRWALDRYAVLGLTTNLEMLRIIARDAEFEAGRTDTGFVQARVERSVLIPVEIAEEALVAATACRLVHQGLLGSESARARETEPDPWRDAGRWRLGRRGIVFHYRWQGRSFHVTASRRPGTGHWRISVGDAKFDVEIAVATDLRIVVKQGDATYSPELVEDQGVFHLLWEGQGYVLEESSASSSETYSGSQEAVHMATTVTAPLPGKLVEMRVKEGDRVAAQQGVLVLEAMKMENLVVAPYAGVVSRLHAREGAQVTKGAPLLDLEPL